MNKGEQRQMNLARPEQISKLGCLLNGVTRSRLHLVTQQQASYLVSTCPTIFVVLLFPNSSPAIMPEPEQTQPATKSKHSHAASHAQPAPRKVRFNVGERFVLISNVSLFTVV